MLVLLKVVSSIAFAMPDREDLLFSLCPSFIIWVELLASIALVRGPRFVLAARPLIWVFNIGGVVRLLHCHFPS